MKHQIQRAILRTIGRLPEEWILRLSGGPRIELGGRRLDPLLHLVWRQAKKQPGMETFDPAAARRLSREGFAALNGPPRPGVSIASMTLDTPAARIPARLYRPANAPRPAPLMLYYHQGGCVIGDLDTCEVFCSMLAERAKCLVLSVDYRLAPEHKFPAATDDAIASYAWARAHATELGGDPSALAVGGDSAGGLLAAVVTHDLKKKGEPQPLLQLLIYPWLTSAGDFASYRTYADAFPLTQPMMDWFAKHYLNSDAERQDTRVSPMLEADFTDLAPAQIVTAGFDPISDEGAAYAEKLQAAGTPVAYRCEEHLTHSFTAMTGAIPAAKQACERIADDVGKALAS